MGVPGFFRWLVNRYPLIRRSMHDPSRPKFNNLYVDMNGIFYKAAEVTHPKQNNMPPEFASEMLRYLDMLVQICRPTDVLFIAVDGCAPYAKNIQQRSRRFRSAHDLQPGSFDRCNFTPGTVFMNDINNCLLDFIKEKKATDSAWMTPKVIYTSSFAPGEGEHKILDYIRSERSSSNWKKNQTHVLYSTDADLIFLSLQTHEPYFTLLREADASVYQRPHEKFESSGTKMKWSHDAFELLHISLVREYMAKDYQVDGDELEKTIDDFVALSFLIGNDFIPEFFDIAIQKGNFNTIVECYKETINETKQHLVIEGAFNKSFLKELLLKIVDVFRIEYNQKHANFPYEEYLRQYILSKYPEHESDLDVLIKDMAFKILDAFNWVLKYYNSGCPSWIWCYKYHYSPPLCLVIPYIDDYECNFEVGEPNPPFLQQLLVLPPQSFKLLPDALQPLMFPPSSISSFYPNDFEIDLNGKRSDYQAIVLIPIINYKIVREEYEKVLDSISSSDLERNKIMKPLLFENDPLNPTELEIKTCILKSINLSTEKPPCTPSFATIKSCLFKEELVPVLQFEYPSKFESIVVTPNNNDNRIITFENAKKLIDKPILFDWPYLKQGIVVSVSDGEKIEKSKNMLIGIPEPSTFQQIKSFLLNRLAIDIGKLSISLQVVPLMPVNIDESEYMNTGEVVTVPYQLTLPVEETNTMERFKPAPSTPPIVNSFVLFIRGPYEGAIGKVLEVKNPLLFKVAMIKKSVPKIEKILSEDSNGWISDADLAKMLKMPFKVIRQILSSVIVKPNNVNIAFTLFSKKKDFVVDGCCKVTENGKVFHIQKSLVPLIQTYIKMTGNLCDILLHESTPNSTNSSSTNNNNSNTTSSFHNDNGNGKTRGGRGGGRGGRNQEKRTEKRDPFAGKGRTIASSEPTTTSAPIDNATTTPTHLVPSPDQSQSQSSAQQLIQAEQQVSKQQVENSVNPAMPSVEPLPVVERPAKQSNNGFMKLSLETIFPGSKAHQQTKLQELTNWLYENSPAAHHPMVPASKNTLSLETVKKIEKVFLTFKPTVVEKEIDNVNSSIVTWPTKHDHVTSTLLPGAGMRVVSVARSGSAPFGEYGTVISSNPDDRSVTVLFDKELKCGTRLEGMLQTNSGLTVMCNDLLIL